MFTRECELSAYIGEYGSGCPIIPICKSESSHFFIYKLYKIKFVMRKVFILIFAFVSSAGSIFASTKVGDLYYILNASNKTAEVTYYEGSYYSNYPNLSTVNIPTSIEYNDETYRVISIGENAFTGCSLLTSVVIPNSVLNIKQWAFSECPRLNSVNLGEGVISIGNSCFTDCSSLSSINIPNSVISIGSGVFSKCTLLSSITIPNSVVSMGGGVFSRCSNLISVNLPEQITKEKIIAVMDFLQIDEANIPTLAEKKAYTVTIPMYKNSKPHDMLPLTKETAISGTAAIANIIILTMTERSFPHTIWKGLIAVVSMISKV